MERDRRILVVDDLPEILGYFRSVGDRLAPYHVEVVTEADPRRAIDRVGHEDFDLVMSDFRMQGADGVDVLSASREARPRARRILMTGYNDVPASISRIRRAQIDAYVQKPLRTKDLMLLLLDFVNDNTSAIEAARKQARELEAVGAREENGA